jgi:ATP-dependent RNA helicase DOB1
MLSISTYLLPFTSQAREKTLTAKERLKAAQELLQMEELKKKTQVLKHLNYCSPTGVLDIKGRIACELSSADELLLTEMLFDGMFTKLTVPETMALLSCLVCDEKSKGQESKLAECLSGPLRQMQVRP